MRVLKRLLALLSCVALPVWAVPQATVDAVVAPAWVERDGRMQPLGVGMEIRHGDRIRTGEGARAYLKLAEGSTVKIGESAQLDFFSRSLRPQSVFKGALDVAAGAFRFTTDALRRIKGRDVAVRVGTATVGIRGTDIWGKSDAERDLVILIEGKVEVKHASGASVELDRPLTTFVAPKGAVPLPVETVTPEILRARARETEIEAGDGAMRGGGKWALSLGDAPDRESALELYDRARLAGYAARIRPLADAGGAWRYEVLLSGFGDESEARQAGARLAARAGLSPIPRHCGGPFAPCQ